MSNFAMGIILGKGFPRAQVHTVHSTSAEGEMMPLFSFHHSRQIYYGEMMPLISFHHSGLLHTVI